MLFRQESLPRINVRSENGKIFCLLDEKVKRFGPVLFENGKQGRHLFGIGYWIASLAAKYCDKPEMRVVEDILNRFHIDFLTTLIIDSRISGNATSYLKSWESNYDELNHDYVEIEQYKDSAYVDGIENYLNVVGAMFHTLSCNVGFSDNASDPSGGGRSNRAIKNIPKLLSNRSFERDLNENIGLSLDYGLLEELFSNGFNNKNIYQLAFIIIQIRELQSLAKPIPHLDAKKIEDDLYQIVFKSFMPKDAAFSQAVRNAVKIIKTIRENVSLNLGQHSQIKSLISRGLDKIYSFSYS